MPTIETPRARILLADDYEPWRVRIRHTLCSRPEWQIVGEAENGVAAVQKTAELRPDVVLLDVAMPILNGIEAAKLIRQSWPTCNIVFLSQNEETDVQAAALAVGAKAYVLKSRAVSELLPAIATALGDGHLR